MKYALKSFIVEVIFITSPKAVKAQMCREFLWVRGSFLKKWHLSEWSCLDIGLALQLKCNELQNIFMWNLFLYRLVFYYLRKQIVEAM